MQRDSPCNLHSDVLSELLDAPAHRVSKFDRQASASATEELIDGQQTQGSRNTALRVKIGLKHTDKSKIKGIHTLKELFSLESSGNTKSQLFVVTHPFFFSNYTARPAVGMVSTLDSILESENSAGSRIRCLRNPDLFEVLLSHSSADVHVSAEINRQRTLLKAKHYIASTLTTVLRSRLLSTNLETQRMMADWHSRASDHVGSNFMKKYKPEAFLVAKYLEEERIELQKSGLIQPAHVSALLSIARRHLGHLFQKGSKSQMSKKFSLPAVLWRAVKYISYWLFVRIPLEYKSFGSFFPHYSACEKLLPLEEFIGWYLPLCWETKKIQSEEGDELFSYDSVLKDKRVVTIYHRLGKMLKQFTDSEREKKFDACYSKYKRPAFLKELFAARLNFQSSANFSDYSEYLNTTNRSKPYIRITHRVTKKVIGYVLDTGLTRAFMTWKKEASDKFCQRCGDRHLTIDCPWVFVPHEAVRDKEVRSEVVAVGAAYCGQATERRSNIHENPGRIISNSRLGISHSNLDETKPRKKRGRPRKDKLSHQSQPSQARAGDSIEQEPTGNVYTCAQCKAFSTRSYAELFRHMKSTCSRKL